jgi:hypothetical protein
MDRHASLAMTTIWFKRLGTGSRRRGKTSEWTDTVLAGLVPAIPAVKCKSPDVFPALLESSALAGPTS